MFVLSSKLSFLGRPFVKRFAYAIRLLSVGLSVCPVYDVGVLWLNGWMDQDETWLCPASLGPSSPSPKGVQPSSPIFPHVLWPDSCVDQDATWYGVGLGPGHIVSHGDPAPPPKRGTTM